MRRHLADNIGNLQEYIRSISQIPRSMFQQKQNLYPFITISRQSGAGGRSLAEALTTRFGFFSENPVFQGWQILDHEICRRILEDPRLRVSADALLKESFLTGMGDYFSQVIAGTSPQIVIFHRVAEIIQSCARVGKVIVVGRAGALITRTLPLGIHVRLVASRPERVQRIMQREGVTYSEAERALTENDFARASLVKTYFSHKDISDPLLYDMIWNTSTVAIPEIASVLMQMVKDKARQSTMTRSALVNM